MQSVTLRLWQNTDAEFVVRVRNHPDLQKWFRQEVDITVEQQLKFMMARPDYHGYIIEANGERVGIVALVGWWGDPKYEFSIAVLPEFQNKGFAKEAMAQICELGVKQYEARTVYSEVFVKNPALAFYLWKCGFKAVGVRERQYYKAGQGLIDVVLIEKEVA